MNQDIVMKTSISRENITDSTKLQVWMKYFKHNYIGICPIENCNNYIIIPPKIYYKLFNQKLNIENISMPNEYESTHFDHIISEHNGGSSINIHNIQPICSKCNLQKSSKNDFNLSQLEIKKRNDKNNIVYMDVDVDEKMCNGVVYDRITKTYRMCKNKANLNNKCPNHYNQKNN